MCIFTHTHTYTHIPVHTNLYTHTHMHTHILVCAYLHIHIYTHIPVHTYTHTHTSTYISTHIHTSWQMAQLWLDILFMLLETTKFLAKENFFVCIFLSCFLSRPCSAKPGLDPWTLTFHSLTFLISWQRTSLISSGVLRSAFSVDTKATWRTVGSP